MKQLSLFVLALGLFCAGCAQKTTVLQQQIVGTWSSTAGSQHVTLEFAKDGSLTTRVGDQITHGTYRVVDDSTIELNGKPAKISIAGDRLTATIGTDVSTFDRATIALATATAAASAVPAPPGAASITKAVMASRITPLSHTPLDVASQFPTAGVMYAVATVANAPSGTQLKGVITAVDTGGAHPPNSKSGEVNATTEGSQNVAFVWRYDNMAAGTYKAEISLNGALVNTLDFTVSKDATPAPALTPGTIGTCGSPQPLGEKPPGFPFGVAMATAVDAQAKAVNPARIFPPSTPKMYAALSMQDAPANTRLAVRWYAEDTGGIEACHTQIGSFEMPAATGSSNAYAFLTAPPGTNWPEGVYSVETYVNGEHAMTTTFGMCDGQCKFQTPVSWTLP